MQLLKRSNKITITGVFILYVGMLIKYILFRRPPDFIKSNLRELGSLEALRTSLSHANLIPFKTILYFLSGVERKGIAFQNLFGNFVGFMPFGLLAPLIFDKIRNVRSMLLLSFFASLAFELTQLVTGLGIFDIDDLILNTAGGVMGYLAFALLNTRSPALHS